ncbi:hypothetical protein BV25DRAFT_1793722 [Artomyces pyxidatus]|uniref:Uncharacterized protein n=1 Tax=Artomyces pyxidatus TaxID=48021 RepID=A0ACB8TIR5_9AGAM|nr:hypothetical protein BV25DRAFT_1793722 [Artomyces pyxidatus]
MSLFRLPAELISNILEYLDCKSLLAWREVCRGFKASVDTSSLLRYQIALYASGMQDGPPGPIAVADRLAKLEAYDEAWRNLEWKAHAESALPSTSLWELYGGIWARSKGRKTLVFRQLPSRTRGVEERQWEVATDVVLRDFGLDSCQDLLVLVEKLQSGTNLCSVHLRTLSSGARHPLAPKSGILEYERPIEDTARTDWSYSIRVSGDYVGILFLNDPAALCELFVWEWKTGVLRLKIVEPQMRSFTFLEVFYVLVGAIESNTGPGFPSLFAYDLHELSTQGLGIEDTPSVCSFQLPLAAPNRPAWELLMSCDPAPNWFPNPELGTPFYTGEDDRLIVLNLQFLVAPVIRSHTIVIHSRVLSTVIATLRRDGGEKVIPWEAWQHGCQLLPEHGHWSTWSCSTFGMRYVCPKPIQRGGVRMVRVRDFHPTRVNRAEEAARDEAGIYGLPQFQHVLPSVIKEVPLPDQLQNSARLQLMISEDNIVALEVSGSLAQSAL